ncbi:MAG: GIY-YIG nuclease family protein [Chitinophagaceae bacterium]|nr:GIY-YIG nuclease family protein [Chitinophagaceae bacterium]
MKIAHNYFVYVVECSDKSYYTGVTNDLDRRLWEHNNDENILCYTFKRRPVVLKYFQRFQDINQAIEFEKQIKGWSRKKKEALFKEDWEALKVLAKSHSKPSSTSSD